MEAVILWFLKANIAIIALYLFYRIVLHRDTFFKEKRFALLFGLIFSVMYPLMNVSDWIKNSKPVTSMAESISKTLPAIVVSPGQRQSFTTEDILKYMYILISIILFLRILWHIGSVLIRAKRGEKEILNNTKIIHLPKGAAPFSFFGFIFINPNEHCTQDLIEILHHEKAHARQLHTLDVLLSELICMIFWINPICWLYKHHLRENLEFLADKDVIHSGFDSKSYQYHLLRLSYQKPITSMVNNFNVSQLKNRITMMNKKKTSTAGLSKYALALPLFILLFLTTYAWGVKQTNKTEVTQKQTETLKSNLDEIKVVGYSQEKADNTDKATQQPNQTESVTIRTEEFAKYPGGIDEFRRYITDHLHYPTSAIEKRIEGRVILSFDVNETGEISNTKVIKGIDQACDDEAKRLIETMPKWIPGKVNGLNVTTTLTIPITFLLKHADENPLLFVDGIEKPFNTRDQIKTETIESVTVLKDSESTKSYGEKGKNGVILIKTKTVK